MQRPWRGGVTTQGALVYRSAMENERKLIHDVPTLLKVLRDSEKPRDVYLARDGGYCVTYGGGDAAAEAVREAVTRGLVAETFPGEGFEYWRLPALVGVGDKMRPRSEA